MAKILVSIDDRLLERLDREAATQGLSRSALIARMAATALGEQLGPGAHPDVHAALDRLAAMGRDIHDTVDSTEIIRQMRDSR